MSVAMALPVKYHTLQLFDYSRIEIETCLERLKEQAAIYASRGSLLKRRRMEVRGLFAAAFTLNATAIWTAKLLERSVFSMYTQKAFFRKRWRLPPGQWGGNAKSCLARAWSGYSLGQDGVCIDRHLERVGTRLTDAVSQWKLWFDLYESMYGSGETVGCVRWHTELLDWISLRGERPSAWK